MANIAIFGTFDVENYGDCLFPVVAAHRLAQTGHTVVAVSPTNTKTRWQDALPPTAVSQISNLPQLGALLIGGGNIIHNHGDSLPTYRAFGVDRTAYTSLWVGAIMAAAVQGIPVGWNAPGVTRPFNPKDSKYLLPNYLRASDYVSVRDAASKAYLSKLHDVDVKVVPDTAVEISLAWPKVTLEPIFRNLLERVNAPQSERYITIHMKSRSFGGEIETLVDGIEGLCKRLSATPILVGLAPCHNDDDAVRLISSRLKIPHVALDNANTLKEIASTIAMADAYIGPSLHGYITSYSYGVPSALIARPKLAKFLGFTEQVGRQEDVVTSWQEAFSQIEARVGSAVRKPDTDAFLKRALDDHWLQITAMIARGPSETPECRMDRVLKPLIERQEDRPINVRNSVKQTLRRLGLKR